MRTLIVERYPAMSKLAWCARVPKTGPIRAAIGSWVEAGETFLFEGAWNGDIQAAGFADSYSFMGSGLIVRESETVIVTPCNNTEAVYSLIDGDDVLFSNSIALLLQAGRARLDKNYLNYEADFLSVTKGLDNYQRDIPLADKRYLKVYYFCNLSIDQDGRISESQKPASPRFRNYLEYYEFLKSELLGIATNAADKRRRHTYPPIVFCSSGYDSSACAALGKEIGCDEAVVFESKKGLRVDSGRAIVEALGYSIVHEHQELEYLQYEQAHLFLSSGELGTSIFVAAAAPELEGKLKLNGVRGDAFWDRRGTPTDPSVGRSLFSDTARKEFRLEVGYINVVPAFLAFTSYEDLHRISNSEEMRPWRLGTDYDRPIPRRIVEEAGVDRALFGQLKGGGAGSSIRFGTLRMLKPVMPAKNFESFEAYAKNSAHARTPSAQWIVRALVYWVFLAATFASVRLSPKIGSVIQLKKWPIKYQCSPFAPSLLFHWAIDEVQAKQYPGVVI